MKRFFASLMLFAVVLAMAAPASAVVVSGSEYTVYLEGESSGSVTVPLSVFDDTPASFVRDGLLVTVSESDTVLNDFNNRISINLSANGDLFPVFNEGAFLGVGTFDFPLELAFPVTLYDARVTLRDLVGNVVFTSDNLVDIVEQSNPWDGSLPTPDTTFFVSEIGGLGVSNITFDFFVSTGTPSDVPEPGSVLLCGAGLLAAFAARRRRQARI